MGSADFIEYDDGRIFGSVVDEEAGDVCQFGADATGNNGVTCTPTSEFPDEGEPLDERRQLQGGLRGLASPELSFPTQDQDERKLQTSSQFDMLVVWTSKSECRNSGQAAGCTLTATTEANMRARIDLAIQETNTAYVDSGVDAQMNLVHAYRHPSYVEASSNAFNAALTEARLTNDGIMDDIHTERATHGADIVAVIIDDSDYCGLGYVGPTSSYMFSVTAWNCATGYYSFGHEVRFTLSFVFPWRITAVPF